MIRDVTGPFKNASSAGEYEYQAAANMRKTLTSRVPVVIIPQIHHSMMEPFCIQCNLVIRLAAISKYHPWLEREEATRPEEETEGDNM